MGAGRCARSAATAWARRRTASSSPHAMSASSRCAGPATSTSARVTPKRAHSARPSTSATSEALWYAVTKVRTLSRALRHLNTNQKGEMVLLTIVPWRLTRT
uniref:CesA-9 n=1 Tax=Arundo donax TaxID=35708 RepID=A0A0A9BCV4_ARUDO